MESNFFAPSINIQRDFQKDIEYIPTPNAEKVFNNIIDNYRRGFKAFNIVGAYGTGKSSFLLAFEKTLNNRKLYFDFSPKSFDHIQEFEFLNIIGEYDSIINSFASKLNINFNGEVTNREIFDELNNYYKNLAKINKGLVLVVDEFGKFLEYASHNNPEKELYFIQSLAEFINDENKDIFLLTTLHQNFHAYALGLTESQQKEWEKVQGRLKEITFNEPVEQLLLLASKRLKELYSNNPPNKFHELFQAIEISNAFPLSDYFTEDIAKSLLPFDILAASILTMALQEYGQNQRSLFSFVESEDHLSLRKFDQKENPYYNLACVYDYLIFNFYSLLSTKYNPHYTQWSAIKSAIERVEGAFNTNIGDAIKLVKAIGLLDIFANKGANIDHDFLESYAKLSLGVRQPKRLLEQLETNKIIRYQKHNNKFRLFEGTDVDIELAINQAGNLVERVTNVVKYLNDYFDFPVYQAKYVTLKKGTPRFFEFKLTEEPINMAPEGEIDGFINLIFNENLDEKDIQKASKNTNKAILFGYYTNVSKIKNLLYEIEKIKKAQQNNLDDKVAHRELTDILEHQRKLLNHYIIDSLYSDNSYVSWYFDGEPQEINSYKQLNRVLSEICETVYPSTPIFQNEIINRTKLTGTISSARKILIEKIVDHYNEKDLNFPENKYPPEKSIYISLLKSTGIHREEKSGYTLGKPATRSFEDLWNIGIDFLEEAKSIKKKISDFADSLRIKPIKLKDGLIEFWAPIFLFINRDKFALYSVNNGEDIYIPAINKEVLNLLIKNPKSYKIKTFDFSENRLKLFNQYRKLLNQIESDAPTNQTFIETIKPFFSFYKGLTEYAKNTQRLSSKAINFRSALENANDPEKLFFEDMPQALGYDREKMLEDENLMQDFIVDIRNTINEISSSYDNLINRIENFIINEFIGSTLSFPEYKHKLQARYKQLRTNSLKPKQKVFYQRLFSPLDDRKSWINSMVQAVVGKSAEKIKDNDEDRFYHEFKDLIYELDNLSDISQNDIDEKSEEILKLEVTSFVQGVQKELIRFPKSKNKQIEKLEGKLKSELTDDKNLNIKLLVKLLQEQINYD